MLKIINNLSPFIEDNYRRISVREYAKLINISPPTASKLLTQYQKENLLIKETDRNYFFFHANQGSNLFIDLSRAYWNEKLKSLVQYLEKVFVAPAVILFGSLAKAEAKSDSDIDLAIFSHKKEVELKKFEQKLKRKIQVFIFPSLKEVPSKELANSILSGYVIKGRLSL